MGIHIGYSTLACPDWTLEESFERGSSYGYDGLEMGMIDGEFVTLDFRARTTAPRQTSGWSASHYGMKGQANIRTGFAAGAKQPGAQRR